MNSSQNPNNNNNNQPHSNSTMYSTNNLHSSKSVQQPSWRSYLQETYKDQYQFTPHQKIQSVSTKDNINNGKTTAGLSRMDSENSNNSSSLYDYSKNFAKFRENQQSSNLNENSSNSYNNGSINQQQQKDVYSTTYKPITELYKYTTINESQPMSDMNGRQTATFSYQPLQQWIKPSQQNKQTTSYASKFDNWNKIQNNNNSNNNNYISNTNTNINSTNKYTFKPYPTTSASSSQFITPKYTEQPVQSPTVKYTNYNYNNYQYQNKPNQTYPIFHSTFNQYTKTNDYDQPKQSLGHLNITNIPQYQQQHSANSSSFMDPLSHQNLFHKYSSLNHNTNNNNNQQGNHNQNGKYEQFYVLDQAKKQQLTSNDQMQPNYKKIDAPDLNKEGFRPLRKTKQQIAAEIQQLNEYQEQDRIVYDKLQISSSNIMPNYKQTDFQNKASLGTKCGFNNNVMYDIDTADDKRNKSIFRNCC